MGSSEKKVAVLLAIVLVGMIGGYLLTQPEAGSAVGEGGDVVDAGCAPAVGGPAAELQEFGQEGAKVEIIAVLPISVGCHAATEAELKKAYEAHPDDIHLTIVDMASPEAADYRSRVGVGWTVVSINGSSTFELDGRSVTLQQMENGTYRTSDIAPIIEDELRKAG